MTDPAPEVEKAAPQPPQRKSRAGLVGLIVALLIVLGGGGVGYYYFLYLPGTPHAVLTEYLALEESGDYEGTYRFLSQRSRGTFSLNEWKAINQTQSPLRAQFSVEYTLGEPKRFDSRCRIPVTAKVHVKEPPPGAAGAEVSQASTLPYILVKEKTGWKVALIEQTIEQNAESMRQQGYSEKDIKEATQALEAMFKQTPAEGQP
jgi:hypothetical protein